MLNMNMSFPANFDLYAFPYIFKGMREIKCQTVNDHKIRRVHKTLISVGNNRHSDDCDKSSFNKYK